MIGSFLFQIYIITIDDGLTCKISKYPDDMKIASKVTTTLDKETLQSDRDQLACWLTEWLMKLGVEKMQSITHRKQQRSGFQHLMDRQFISAVNKKYDLGITQSRDLNPVSIA